MSEMQVLVQVNGKTVVRMIRDIKDQKAGVVMMLDCMKEMLS